MKFKKLGGKKAYFFSVDAVLAVSILLTGIFLVFYVITVKPIETPTYHLSEDIMNVLAKTKINNLSEKHYPYIYSLIENREIIRADNSILEQVGEFYYFYLLTGDEKYNQTASSLIQNITRHLIPSQNGFVFKIYVDNTPDELYRIETALVSEEDAAICISIKKIIFGRIDTKDKWGPYVVESKAWR